MSDADHDDGQTPDTANPRPSALPNPLAGNIKLTLPGNQKPSHVGRVPPRPDRPSDADSADPQSLTGPGDPPRDDDVDATGSDDESGTTSDPVAQEGEPDGTSGGFDGNEDESDSRWADRGLIKVLALGVAAVVVLAGIVWWSSRPAAGPQQPSGRQVAMPTGAAQVPAGGTKPAVPDDVLPATFTAECPGQTDPKLAASTDPRSAWTCPTNGVPFGQKIIATLPKPYVITGIKFWPGFQGTGPDGRDAWFHYRVLMEGQLVFNDIDRTLVPLRPLGARAEYSQPLNRILASVVEFTVMASDPPPAEPKTTPTSAPPGAPASGEPDLGELFPRRASRTSNPQRTTRTRRRSRCGAFS